MFGMFKKKAKIVQREVKNFEKRDLMQACVGIALLVGWADGEIDDKELKVLTDVGMMLGLRLENYLQV